MKATTIRSKARGMAQALVGGVIVVGAATAWACPSCGEAIEGDPAALSFYWSTLFMIAMPYALVLGVGGSLMYVYWRAARNAAEMDSAQPMSWSAPGPEKEGGR